MEQIVENPYLQYFWGLMAYQEEAPFHHSLLPTFRKHFTLDSLGKINEAIARLIADALPIAEKPGEVKGGIRGRSSERPAPRRCHLCACGYQIIPPTSTS